MKRRDWPILRGIRLCSSRLDLTAFEYPTPQPKPSKFHKNKTKASHSKKGNTRLPTTADGGDGSGEETVVESDQTRVSTRKRPSEGSHDTLALGARRSSRNIQRVSCASDSANATARRHGHVKQEKDDDYDSESDVDDSEASFDEETSKGSNRKRKRSAGKKNLAPKLRNVG